MGMEVGICLMLGGHENLVFSRKYHPCLSHSVNRVVCGRKGCGV